MKLLAKLYGKKLQIVRSSNKNRFSQKLSLALKAGGLKKARLQVIYGRGKSNIGEYLDKKELLRAYNAFTEPILLREVM